MKKSLIMMILIFCIFIIPLSVNAEKVYTTVVGNDKVRSGSNIKYIVILDKTLTEYEAEITYDRNVLNLVSVDEVKIDSQTKAFSVEKSDPIKISVTSEKPTLIAYAITFDVKNSAKFNNTELGLKTINSSTIISEKTQKLETVDTNYTIVYDGDDVLDNKYNDSDAKNDSSIKNTVNDFKKIFDDYGDIITYSSLILNLILVICLIRSLIIKKVDYDF